MIESGSDSALSHICFVQFKDIAEYQPGQQLKVEDVFKVGDLVDVAGKTIGKGFQGIWLCATSPRISPLSSKQFGW